MPFNANISNTNNSNVERHPLDVVESLLQLQRPASHHASSEDGEVPSIQVDDEVCHEGDFAPVVESIHHVDIVPVSSTTASRHQGSMPVVMLPNPLSRQGVVAEVSPPQAMTRATTPAPLSRQGVVAEVTPPQAMTRATTPVPLSRHGDVPEVTPPQAMARARPSASTSWAGQALPSPHPAFSWSALSERPGSNTWATATEPSGFGKVQSR